MTDFIIYLSTTNGAIEVSETEKRYIGTLKFFLGDRPNTGYGFIVRQGGDGINDFVHAQALRDSGVRADALVDGQTRMEYSLIRDDKNQKLKAIDIRILD